MGDVADPDSEPPVRPAPVALTPGWPLVAVGRVPAVTRAPGLPFTSTPWRKSDFPVRKHRSPGPQ